MNFEQYYVARQQRVDSILKNVLPKKESSPTHLHDAMHYAVLSGGKRIRPLLVYATGEALGVDLSLLDYPASAVELIHAYSLVHDDLPGMDNDDLRRGMPTCHKAFDEATAILVGDALQTLAFQVLAEQSQIVSPQICIEMISCLANATGSLGMAGGQALDLRATGKQVNNQELEEIHHLKTGALILACVRLGILAANLTDANVINALHTFAHHIGLCFQIQDDILDFEGTISELGKQVGTDQVKKKATFSTLSGVENAKNSLAFFYAKATDALSYLGEKSNTLRGIAEYIVIRNT